MKNIIEIMELEWAVSIDLVALACILKAVGKFCICITDISICK
jgi:hypothetical protein